MNVGNQNKESVMLLCVTLFAGSLVSLLLRVQIGCIEVVPAIDYTMKKKIGRLLFA